MAGLTGSLDVNRQETTFPGNACHTEQGSEGARDDSGHAKYIRWLHASLLISVEIAYVKAQTGNQHLLEVRGTESGFHGGGEALEPPGAGRQLEMRTAGFAASSGAEGRRERVVFLQLRSRGTAGAGAHAAPAGDTLEVEGRG